MILMDSHAGYNKKDSHVMSQVIDALRWILHVRNVCS